eukprot:CAMPEP_0198200916 /NCGR_PEP_ID=MMETSP1445-20131203/3799_1 /TAXON_ID=36898 /ORGANISM="Pyramimonas sp., Strain CCMP2087" /LENGTH=197 /DNA_ID=CAMNT_0043871083 /DNA_START=334 /DNA_END=924 /DNA_ORIENTATION=+
MYGVYSSEQLEGLQQDVGNRVELINNAERQRTYEDVHVHHASMVRPSQFSVSNAPASPHDIAPEEEYDNTPRPILGFPETANVEDIGGMQRRPPPVVPRAVYMDPERPPAPPPVCYKDPERRRERSRLASQRARQRTRQREEQVGLLQQQLQSIQQQMAQMQVHLHAAEKQVQQDRIFAKIKAEGELEQAASNPAPW